MTTALEELILRINPPQAWWSKDVDDRGTILTVDSANRHGSLLEVVQLLTDLDLNIPKATISSDGSWFLDEFHVTDYTGKPLEEGPITDYISGALTGQMTDFVYGRDLVTPAGRPVRRNLTFGEHSAIELTGADWPGLLSACAGALSNNGCSVVAAALWTHAGRCACVIYVCREGGGPCEDPALQERVKFDLHKAIQPPPPVPPSLLPARVEFSLGLTHPERRLHQMLFADRDYDATNHLRELDICVRNCTETNYCIISIKCPDRPKLFFDTVCTITDMQYVIYHAAIDSKNGIAEQEYFIKHMDGGLIDSGAERVKVTKCLAAAVHRRNPEGLRLELRAGDRKSLLLDVTRMFREAGLSVNWADIETQGAQAVNVFYVTKAQGGLPDMHMIDSMLKDEMLAAHLRVVPREERAKRALADRPSPSRLETLVRHGSEQFFQLLGLRATQCR